MAALAKGLPIVFIPEKITISAMGNDMIYHGRRGQYAVFLAFRAQGIPGQKNFSRPLPARIVPPRSRAATKGVVAPFLAMFFAVDVSVTEIGASRIPTGAFGRMGHIGLLFRQ